MWKWTILGIGWLQKFNGTLALTMITIFQLLEGMGIAVGLIKEDHLNLWLYCYINVSLTSCYLTAEFKTGSCDEVKKCWPFSVN